MEIPKHENHQFFYISCGQLWEMYHCERKNRTRPNHALDCPGYPDKSRGQLDEEDLEAIAYQFLGFQSIKWRRLDEERPKLLESSLFDEQSEALLLTDGNIVTSGFYRKDAQFGDGLNFDNGLLSPFKKRAIVYWLYKKEVLPPEFTKDKINQADEC